MPSFLSSIPTEGNSLSPLFFDTLDSSNLPEFNEEEGVSGLFRSIQPSINEAIEFDEIGRTETYAYKYDPNHQVPSDLHSISNTDASGFTAATLKRLSTYGEMILAELKEDETEATGILGGLGGLLGNFGGFLNNGSSSGSSMGLDLLQTNFVGLGNFGAAGLDVSISRLNSLIQESGQHLATVASQLNTDNAEGNIFQRAHSVMQLQAKQFRVGASVASIIDAPLINLAGQQTIINSRSYHNSADLSHNTHLAGYYNYDDSLTIHARQTRRYNYDSLKEVSTSVESVGARHFVYGDNLWLQAGQDSNVPIATPNPADNLLGNLSGAQDLLQSLFYGVTLIKAQRAIALGSGGPVIIAARGPFALDGFPLFINMGVASTLHLIPNKIVGPITGKPTVATSAQSEPEAPVQVQGQTSEPARYVYQDIDEEEVKAYGLLTSDSLVQSSIIRN